jgi:hypothetical protein
LCDKNIPLRSYRDGAKRTVESLPLTNDDNGSDLFEAIPD